MYPISGLLPFKLSTLTNQEKANQKLSDASARNIKKEKEKKVFFYCIPCDFILGDSDEFF